MLEVTDLAIAYDNNTVVEQVSFQLKKGEIGCLLGPSGCGKTSLLRAISGFEHCQQGSIALRGVEVSKERQHTPPEKRNVAVVFQDFALFPHLSVAENIAFALHRETREFQRQRVHELLDLIGLEGIAERYIHSLSGGQQQRVALARALASQPDVLLLDEPFSSLDADLREELAGDIRHILKTQGITALMVTHDQHEAFNMADVIGVMYQGKLQQWGSAYDLYHKPLNPFVADFIGQGTFVKGRVKGGLLQTSLGVFPLPQVKPEGVEVDVLIRPDDILHNDNSEVKGQVLNKAFRGAHILYTLLIADKDKVLCLAPSHHDHPIGTSFGITTEVEHLVFFEINQSYSSSI